MLRNIGCSLLIYVLALFSPPDAAAQDTLNSFRERLMDFAHGLQPREGALEFLTANRIKVISQPKAQTVEILRSARLLVEDDRGLEAVPLRQLVSDRDLQWMADLLIEKGVIRQDDYFVQVAWSLHGQKFYTLAAVHPKALAGPSIRPFRELEAPDFEPLLYFTPMSTQVDHIDGETSSTEEGVENKASTRVLPPVLSGRFASMTTSISAVAARANDAWQRSGSRKLTIWNGHGPCVTVILKVVFTTDGCRISDEGSHTFPSVEPSESLSCLFWDVEHKPVETRTWKRHAECPPRPGTGERAEECLKAMLEYTPGLRLLTKFIPLRKPASTEPQYVCCGK